MVFYNYYIVFDFNFMFIVAIYTFGILQRYTELFGRFIFKCYFFIYVFFFAN